MVFASLRFDDAIHVKPLELEMRPDVGLLGVAWQTKVERKRRGTKFIVPNVGFTDGQWLWVGWELFNITSVPERDFWVPDLNTVEVFNSFPPDYNRSVLWFRWLAHDAFTKYGTIAPPKATSDKIKTFTMHSPRVTMLDAAVHQGRTPQEIGLQANWKDPGPMVLKYTRNRSTIPAVMMQQLVADLKDAFAPKCISKDDLVDEGDDDLLPIAEVFLKIPDGSASSYEYKYHCSSKADYQAVACGSDCLLMSVCM